MPAAIPPPIRLRDVVVGPLDPGSSKTVVRFGALPCPLGLPHWREDGRGGLVDIVQQRALAPEEAEAAPVMETPVLYAGPYFRHFGHFVAESVHRLYARRLWPDLAAAPMALLGSARHGQRLEGWAAAVLEACGVPRDQVMLVDRPTRFRELVVPAMGRVLAGRNLLEGYAGLFPLAPLPPAGLGAARRFYLTRAGHLRLGGILGERLIERSLGAAGFTVVDPTDVPLRSLLGALAAAEVVVAAEGSALHNLDLCGRVKAGVMVVGRRPGTRERFRRVLDNATSRWEVLEGGHDGLGLQWDARLQGAGPGRRVTYVPLRATLRAIGRFAGKDVPLPSAAEVAEAVEADLGRYLLDPATQGRATPEEVGRLLLAMRERHQAGLATAASE